MRLPKPNESDPPSPLAIWAFTKNVVVDAAVTVAWTCSETESW